MGKHKAIFDFFENCPLVQDKFFNFGDNENGNTIIAPISTDDVRTYYNGSKLRAYQFMIRQIKSVSRVPNDDLNVTNIELVESLMDWIKTQIKNKNYPAMEGVQDMKVMNNIPDVVGSDKEGVLYAFSCRALYLERE